MLTKVIGSVPRAPPRRPISKQRCRGRKVSKWLVRRAPQAIGSLIPSDNDLCFGADSLSEDLTFAPLVPSLSRAEESGALLATTLLGKGLFEGNPFALDIAGTFASDLGREYFAESDLVIAAGAGLGHYTTEGSEPRPLVIASKLSMPIIR
jgi:Thiamine pyrophosphate enzyme, central domain